MGNWLGHFFWVPNLWALSILKDRGWHINPIPSTYGIFIYLHLPWKSTKCRYTWNPNDLCFDWKRPSFPGFKPHNKGQVNIHVYRYKNISYTDGMGMFGRPLFFLYWPTVDGRDPVNQLRLVGFYTSQLVQDFFHQQYFQGHVGVGLRECNPVLTLDCFCLHVFGPRLNWFQPTTLAQTRTVDQPSDPPLGRVFRTSKTNVNFYNRFGRVWLKQPRRVIWRLCCRRWFFFFAKSGL